MRFTYQSAFPDAQYLDISNFVIPYWLLNSEELEDFFIDSEANDHNQRNVFKEAVVMYKKENVEDALKEKVHYDSPILFDIAKVFEHVKNKDTEMVAGKTAEKMGPLNGKLSNFVNRLENKINDKRLDFLLGDNAKSITFEDTLRQFLSYKTDSTSNVTIIDLSGVPFEVLNITVSLISRLLFEFGFYSKKYHASKESETPYFLCSDIIKQQCI